MTRYPYLTTLVYRKTDGGNVCLHTYNHLESAASKEEAYGQAVLAGEKIFPNAQLVIGSAGTSFLFPEETVKRMAESYGLLQTETKR